MSYLYDCLARYGNCYALKDWISPHEVMEKLSDYEDSWVQYNPRKNIPREGLSITSLDGGLSGIPDLDSVREYNVKNNLLLDETSFNKTTELWPIVEPVLSRFKNHLGRTHFIKMHQTGCFPTHRDFYYREIKSFRLFIPLYNCNPPYTYFILDNQILNFEHGQVYFLETCKEHTVFTCDTESLFVVANIILDEKSVDLVLDNMQSR